MWHKNSPKSGHKRSKHDRFGLEPNSDKELDNDGSLKIKSKLQGLILNFENNVCNIPKIRPNLQHLGETANVEDLKENGQKNEKIANAFELLMGARGYTQQRTPVKIRVKSLTRMPRLLQR